MPTPYTACSIEKLKSLWMGRVFAGASEKFDAEVEFDNLMWRIANGREYPIV